MDRLRGRDRALAGERVLRAGAAGDAAEPRHRSRLSACGHAGELAVGRDAGRRFGPRRRRARRGRPGPGVRRRRGQLSRFGGSDRATAHRIREARRPAGAGDGGGGAGTRLADRESPRHSRPAGRRRLCPVAPARSRAARGEGQLRAHARRRSRAARLVRREGVRTGKWRRNRRPLDGAWSGELRRASGPAVRPCCSGSFRMRCGDGSPQRRLADSCLRCPRARSRRACCSTATFLHAH